MKHVTHASSLHLRNYLLQFMFAFNYCGKKAFQKSNSTTDQNQTLSEAVHSLPMSTHACNDADEGKATSKEDDETGNTPQHRMIVPRGQGVAHLTSQNSLGDSNVPPSSSNATSQEAISVLLRAAMTSEPQESINPSPYGFAGGIETTSTAPLNQSIKTHAVAPKGQNLTGNSEPMNDTTVDNNWLRAAIAAQIATTREPSAALGQNMVSAKCTTSSSSRMLVLS